MRMMKQKSLIETILKLLVQTLRAEKKRNEFSLLSDFLYYCNRTSSSASRQFRYTERCTGSIFPSSSLLNLDTGVGA